jgi:hypothetical protein
MFTNFSFRLKNDLCLTFKNAKKDGATNWIKGATKITLKMAKMANIYSDKRLVVSGNRRQEKAPRDPCILNEAVKIKR